MFHLLRDLVKLKKPWCNLKKRARLAAVLIFYNWSSRPKHFSFSRSQNRA